MMDFFDPWQEQLSPLIQRFNREAQAAGKGMVWDFPEEVTSSTFYRELTTGTLEKRLGVPFWELVKPKKNDRCLDVACGGDFFFYPWTEWQANFWGQDLSPVLAKVINSRAPQLNSKLFKGVRVAGAHRLDYEENFFDLVLALGLSFYMPLDYSAQVLIEIRRVVKPGAPVLFEVVEPNSPWLDAWGLMEMAKGTEVYFTELEDWETTFKQVGSQIQTSKAGELFRTYHLTF
jgi:ubiquinone/menaquinone biosynthesis C-methylase UbiE